jgi:hypothetical protein
MNDHEEKLIRAFIVPDKRNRYLSLFGTKKGRAKLTDRLDHTNDFDSRCPHKIPAPMQSRSGILLLLKQKGAPSDCYVISTNSRIDGRQVDPLSETVGLGLGTVISCIPGELVYFEAEDPGERYLLLGASMRRQ